jgi:sucrose-6-phosphate hydrolase SacC (GH32 family)
MPIAVYPDRNGACWSGSGVVDRENSSGFQTGKEPPLVLAYTNAGATFGQSLAYSNDRGRTWKTYEGNPVLGQIAPSNRDPLVFWHEPTRKWVMVLYVKRGSAHFFTSDDLKDWTPASEVRLAGFHECPDLFELPIDGDEWDTKWVLYDARSMYWLGRFDGTTFTPEAGPLRVEHGRNFYAAQTWDCGWYRRVQIGWMSKAKYPGMPFNQQMSFPCELILRTGPKGVRLYRYPVPTIEKLHNKKERVELADVTVAPGENPLDGVRGELFDVRMEVEPRGAAEWGLRLFGQSITYARGRLSCLGASTNVAPVEGVLKLRVLVDRASIEVFANDGEASLTSWFLPKQPETGLELFAKGGDIRVRSLVVAKLRSAWEKGDDEPGAKPR